jgi:hypothetical protein
LWLAKTFNIEGNMSNNYSLKLLSVAVLAASLAACGGSSSSSNDTTTTTATANLSSNPDFTFDAATYVGAVDPAATSAWYSFALTGSYPAVASDIVASNAIVAWTNTVEGDFTPNMAGITPATECPTLASGTVVQESATVSLDGSDFVKCRLSGSISSNVTLSNTVAWSLVGQVVVGNGNKQLTAANIDTVTDVTLTVDAGTIFMSKAGSSLIVTRGSKLVAEGTAEHPIIMSGDDTTTFAGNNAAGGDGEWGGLVIQGFAYNNLCDDPETNTYCNRVGEGDAGYFGGFNNADNSGSLKYLIVTEAGAQTGADGDELNGISFQAVGYGTTVDYVQINNNYDDGIELFGGAVDVKHIVVTAAKDDSIDWDEGYVGNIQHALIVQTLNQESGKTSNHVFEMDTKGDAAESAFQESNPTVANVTALVSRNGLGNSDGLHQKEGTEGQFFNIFMAGDINTCLYVKDNTVGTSYTPRSDAYNGIYCVGATTAVSKPADADYDGLTSVVDTSSTYFELNDNLALTATPATAFNPSSKEVDGSASAQ